MWEFSLFVLGFLTGIILTILFIIFLNIRENVGYQESIGLWIVKIIKNKINNYVHCS